MKELLIDLRAEMGRLADDEAFVRKARADLEESLTTRLAMITECRKNIDDIKAQIVPLALAEYKATGSKTLIGGIGIRHGKPKTEYVITDEKKALAFAKSKDMFITLNKKAMVAGAAGFVNDDGVDFIEQNTTTPDPVVTFPKEIKLDE